MTSMNQSTRGRGRKRKSSALRLKSYFSWRPIRQPLKYDSTSSEEEDTEHRVAPEPEVYERSPELRVEAKVPVTVGTSTPTTTTITTTNCIVSGLTLCTIGKQGQINTFDPKNISSISHRPSENTSSKLQGIRRRKVLKF